MALTNLLAPTGLVHAREAIGGASTYQNSVYRIKAGYGSNIGVGDLVKTGQGANQGYIVLADPADTAVLGVFAGIGNLGYYDKSALNTLYGLNGSYQSTANPNSDGIDCFVIDDPFAVFRVQAQGGPYLLSWRGQNITFNQNGAPNGTGQSTLQATASSISVNPLPLRVVGLASVSPSGFQDSNVVANPTTNPWLEVRLNIAEMLSTAGI